MFIYKNGTGNAKAYSDLVEVRLTLSQKHKTDKEKMLNDYLLNYRELKTNIARFLETNSIDSHLNFIDYYSGEKTKQIEVINDGRKGKIIVKKFRIKESALAKNISLALYKESNERTVDFIRQNIKKETLTECISTEKDCYSCSMECPRNSEFVYGVLCDGVLDDVIDGIKVGLTDEQLNEIIWKELGLKRGYQLGIRKMAVNCIEGRGTDYFSEDDPEIEYLIPKTDVK